MEITIILWTIVSIIIGLMFIIPFIYWIRKHTIFYSWNEMLDGGKDTPLYITVLLRLDLTMLLIGTTLLIMIILDSLWT